VAVGGLVERKDSSHTRRTHWAKEFTSNDGLPIFSESLFAIIHNLALTIRNQNVFVYLFMAYLMTLSHLRRVQRRMTG
jgi:hypothetical protein